jgi:hypothetical protein
VQTWYMVPRPSLPQYCSFGWPMCWDYASFIKECNSGSKVVHQNMASQYEEGQQVGNKIFIFPQHGKAKKCHNFYPQSAN